MKCIVARENKSMRIAFDATALLSSMSKNRGIGNYSYGQFWEMIRQDQTNEYYFFNLYDPNFDINAYLGVENKIVSLNLYSGPEGALFSDKFGCVIELILKRFLTENKIDVFYITSPFDGKYLKYKAEWFQDVKTVALVYDIIPYVFKERYLPGADALKGYMGVINFLRKMDRLQVISQSVKDDLISYLDFDADKIDVIWGAVGKQYKEIEISDDEKNNFLLKFGITGKFIMCTGGDDERKNIAGLIDSYAALPGDVKNEYQLVVVCKLSKASEERYNNLCHEKNVEGRVVLTNFVSDSELLWFYNLATLMAFPSTYEGFGLPVVEAWACGTPVLTSNNSSLVQIAGGGAVLVDPFDSKDVTRGLQYALTECDLDELLRKGKKELEKYQWEKVAKSSIDSINKFANEYKKRRDAKEDETNINPSNQHFKIAFFTPLPPLQSGISDYSYDIIQGLSKYCDIDVFIDDGYEADCNFDKSVTVMNHRKYVKLKDEYYDTIYQVGNSAFHTYMFSYIKKYSGTVVLHDYNLHGVLVHMCFAKRIRSYVMYKKVLLEDHSKDIVYPYVADLKRGKTGYHIYDIPVNGFVTKYANKIIVHSIESKKKLLTSNMTLDVEHIWHYAKPEEGGSGREQIRKKLGYAEDDIVIAAFGHIHETKRTIPSLQMFVDLQKEYPNAKMLFVGKLSDSIEKEFNAFVKENKIEECVKVTGYIELDEFVDYIDATDICLNLRYPYNGETSGSLMRFFAKGKCVVVNDIGSFGEFPEGVCVKLPSVDRVSQSEEIENLLTAVKSLISNPEIRKQYELNSLKFAKEQLDLEIIAKKYYDFICRPARHNLKEEWVEELLEVCAKRPDFCAEELADTLTYIM